MTIKLHHPLWTHIVGLAYVVAIYAVVLTHPIPDRLPLQFNAAGEPVRWGSSIEFYLHTLGWPLVMLIGSIILDEINARQEPQRRFNWLAPLDEMALGVFLAVVLKLTPQLGAAQPVFTFPWLWMLGLGGSGALLAIVLERLRPFRPAQAPPPAEYDLSSPELDQITHAPGSWLYWEAQDPAYFRIVIVLTVVLLGTSTVITASVFPFLALITALPALIVLLVYGGMRVTVTPRQVVLRVGLLGIPIRRIKLAEVESIEAISFSPIADFGGWGPGRYSFRLKA